MMNQRSPLLNHRIKSENITQHNSKAIYDYTRGMWVENGVPVIKTLLEKSQEVAFGDTMLTATREGIDKSENSSALFGQTQITTTREAIDQSERISDYYMQTTITKTREAIDQSENSG